MGEWRKTNIEEIATVNMGQSPDSNFVNEVEYGTPFLQGNAEFGTRTPAEVFWCTRPRKMAQKEDVLVSVRAPVGEVNIADKEYCIGRGLAAVDFWGLNKAFASYAFSNVVPQLHIKSQGTTFLAVSKGDIEKAVISYAISAAEQAKIAKVLATVDEAIDKTCALIEKYKNIKAGMMQDLLGDSACVGYEKKSMLGNVQIINGGTPSTQISSYWNGTIGWLSVEDFNMGHRFVYSAKKTITEAGLRYSSTKILKTGQLIISARGTVGVVAQMGCDLAFNQSCYGLVSTLYWTNDFLYYYLLFIADRVRSITHGNVFGTITKSTFKDILVPLISKTVQDDIVEQLTAADEKIETECGYLTKLQDIKRGLMQDLLTNTVSVDALL